MTNRNTPRIVKDDTWLQPYSAAIEGRMSYFQEKLAELTHNGSQSLEDFAQGYLYYGLHLGEDGWVFREWAPHAERIFLVGDFSDWQELPEFELHPIGEGNWEMTVPQDRIHHEQYYKLKVHWDGGSGERIPAWVQRVVQDTNTHLFSAQVWEPKESYTFRVTHFKPRVEPLLIYECHIGMALEEERVGSYLEFRDQILPRIAGLGYNAIQIMAIQEHPYYGSFGYHVSNFFAASSRFGTPEELKSLIDRAHELGIAVIMDIVHSHAVKNDLEGIGNIDGSNEMYFHQGEKRIHPAWDSLCFDYHNDKVLHFLLSNCQYWIKEFQFDGFRFDGVTSMIYYSHGLNETFAGYKDYFNGNQDGDALCYLALANQLIHEINPRAITIAEEMSGMPGLAAPVAWGGVGFDYRLAMGIPDFWIKTLKEKSDEKWNVGDLFWTLTNRRKDEKTISYAESHDQALVGDKTIFFRLVDEKIYWHMMRWDQDLTIDRGIALHKMIRLMTSSTTNGGYLNFMGNEFGHPEWIDFPRDGNGWSHHYARRQWSLVDRPDLKYQFLNRFDQQMISLLKKMGDLFTQPVEEIWTAEHDQVVVFKRGKWVFAFNFNPSTSFSDYGVLLPEGKYKLVLNTDDISVGGNGCVDPSVAYFTQFDPLYHEHKKGWLMLYIPARTALVLEWND